MHSPKLGVDDVSSLLAFAEQLAREAGDIALAHFGTDVTRERKRDGSIVTLADREAEQHMRQRISEVYRDDGIIGEEFGTTEGRTNRTWILDPIDGTFSFAHGVPLFGALIGIVIGGVPSVGVIRLPALDETVSAVVGRGCSWNGKPAAVSRTARMDDAFIVCGDFYVARSYGFGAAVERLQASARDQRGWGDCYAYALVATGRADVALDPVMNVWDCAALAPVIEEAGGTFTDWQGRRTIHGGNAIATNGLLFEDVMRLVRGEAS